MATLVGSMDKAPSPIYFTQAFEQMIRDHLKVILDMTTNQIRTIDSDSWIYLNVYTGDVKGFLTALGYQREYHWTIMLINGIRSNFDLTTDLKQLIIPDWDYINRLAQLVKEKK